MATKVAAGLEYTNSVLLLLGFWEMLKFNLVKLMTTLQEGFWNMTGSIIIKRRVTVFQNGGLCDHL